ncbi:AMP-binding protein [Acinetobacter defluvii]|uniref:AMP-binding protein n=1 Tax=Acinetobacter defluvii TaxID=1871111 RepID=A0A2S2FFX4_9GAMM|nr:AMP-binding protein [Acinetobacter defluvii]AWL29873.1 AMP-binding protein [Acinetobacter defluvii]
MLCHFQTHIQSSKIFCIQEDLRQISFADFWQDVYQQANLMQGLDAKQYALWENNSYEFLVLFFAALLGNKQLVLVPNRVKDLELELAEQGIYFLTRQQISEHSHDCVNNITPPQLQFDDHFLQTGHVYFYTSGSTGQPKKIPRTLRQLLNEVQGLDQSFDLDKACIAIATVSHQHIYGLLFKLLLPLASGRSFYSPQLAFPEDVVAAQQRLSVLKQYNYVISSPALLKRWTKDVVLQECQYVYSSGGKLESGVRPYLNRPIVEVLGSSETGGIAHRQQDDALWTPFANVQIQVTEQEELGVKTNHAFTEDWIFTGDRAKSVDATNSKSVFQLLGRLDRIVKLEEKRLSLDAIEQKILSLHDVVECHALLLEKEHRQILACVTVLTESAQQVLVQGGKACFVAQLKQQLIDKLESIAIPRQWRFLSQLPRNSQSKLNKQMMQALFQPQFSPVVLQHQQNTDNAKFQLEFSPELECFKGHFPDYSIYPGVGQISFIQQFAKQIWSDLAWCNGYEQLKFQDLIKPFAIVELTLVRKQHKVHFEMRSAEQLLASGRLLFALQNVQNALEVKATGAEHV